MRMFTVARLSRWIAGLLLLATFLCASTSRLATQRMGAASQALWTASGQLDDLTAAYRSWTIRDTGSTLSRSHAALLGHGTSAVASELARIDREDLPRTASGFVASALQRLSNLGMAETAVTYRMVGNGLRQAGYELRGAQDRMSGAPEASGGNEAAAQKRAGAGNTGASMWIVAATLATLAAAVSMLVWVSMRSDKRNGVETRSARAPDARPAAPPQRSELDEMLARIAAHSSSGMPLSRQFPKA